MFVDDAPDYKQIPEHGVHDIGRDSAVGRCVSHPLCWQSIIMFRIH
jgi:hypothetical protein